jgi:transcriptional regulator with XRE-family HTH domain
MTTISKRLARAREYRGFKHAKEFAVANKLEYGTYLAHESGNRNPKISTIAEYARLLKVNLQWLTHGTGAMLEPDDIAYEQTEEGGGLTDAPYSGSVWRSQPVQSVAQEVADFLQHFNQLSPQALKAVVQVLRDDLLATMPADEAINAIKSGAAEKGVSASDQSVSTRSKK